MAKILKNTTIADIEVDNLGITIPASGQIDLVTGEYLLLASDDVVTELTSLINAGDIVVNDGNADLSAADGIAYIQYPDDALNIRFDNTVAQLNNNPNNVQAAIEGVKGARFQYLQFQFIGNMNFDQYLIVGPHRGDNNRRSGDPSNGYRFSNSAPACVAFGGNINAATAAIRGIAQSTGAPAANMELKFELWKVGMTGSEGTKLGDIIFNIVSANYTIGNFWNASIVTQFESEQAQDVDVTAGDLLGLKFIRQTGNNKVVAVQNTTIVLALEGAV